MGNNNHPSNGSSSTLNSNNNGPNSSSSSSSNSGMSNEQGEDLPDRPQAQRPPVPTPSFGTGLDDMQARLNNLFFENFQNFQPFNFAQNINQYPGANRGGHGNGRVNNNPNFPGTRRSFQFQTGIFPSIFGFQFQTYNNQGTSSSTNNGNPLPREEEEQQLFLSRILLMVGTFLIFCLILF